MNSVPYPAEEFFDRAVLDKIAACNRRLWLETVDYMARESVKELRRLPASAWNNDAAARAVAEAYGEDSVEKALSFPICRDVLAGLIEWLAAGELPS